MKRFMKKTKMRGFTLVELLIVIIIIGILAGALLLVAGAGTDKANATKMVSDSRSIKSAALMYYADNGSWPADIAAMKAYLDRDVNASGLASYDVGFESTNAIFNVKLTNITTDTGIRNKLIAIAAEGGLYESESGDTAFAGSDNDAYLRIKATQ